MSNSFSEHSSLAKLIIFYEQQTKNGDYTFFEADDFAKIIEYYKQNNKKNKALSSCRIALKHFPFNINLLFLRTNLYLADFEYDYAIQTLEKITVIEPDNALAFYMMAEAYINQGDPEEALDMLEVASNLNYPKSDILKLKAEICKMLDENDDALEAFEQYLDMNPLDIEMAYDYTITGFIADEQKRILNFTERLTDKNLYSNISWFILGRAYECCEIYDKAIEALEISVAYKQNYGNAVFLLATCYFKSEQYKQALELFKNSIELEFAVDNSFIQAGFCCFYLDMYDEARKYLKKAESLNPSDPDIYFGLGLIEFTSEKFNKAISYYRKAIRIFKYSASYWSELAFTYAYTGKFLEANKAYKEAIDIEPDDVEIQLDYLYFLREIGWNFIAVSEAMELLNTEFPDAEIMYFTVGLLFESNYIEESQKMMINALQSYYEQHHLLFEHYPNLVSNQLFQSLIEKFKPE